MTRLLPMILGLLVHAAVACAEGSCEIPSSSDAVGADQIVRVTALFEEPCVQTKERPVHLAEAVYCKSQDSVREIKEPGELCDVLKEARQVIPESTACESPAGTGFPVAVVGSSAYFVTANHVIQGFEKASNSSGRKLVGFALRHSSNCLISGAPPDYRNVEIVAREDDNVGRDIALLRAVTSERTLSDNGVMALPLSLGREQLPRNVSADEVGVWGFPMCFPHSSGTYSRGELHRTDLRSNLEYARWTHTPISGRPVFPGMSGGPVLLKSGGDVSVVGLLVLEMSQDGSMEAIEPTRANMTEAEWAAAIVKDQADEKLVRAAMQEISSRSQILSHVPPPNILATLLDALEANSRGKPARLRNAVRELLASPEAALVLAKLGYLVELDSDPNDICGYVVDGASTIELTLEKMRLSGGLRNSWIELTRIERICTQKLAASGRATSRPSLFRAKAILDSLYASNVKLSPGQIKMMSEDIFGLYKSQPNGKQVAVPATDALLKLASLGEKLADEATDPEETARYRVATLVAVSKGIEFTSVRPDLQRTTLVSMRKAAAALEDLGSREPAPESISIRLRACADSFASIGSVEYVPSYFNGAGSGDCYERYSIGVSDSGSVSSANRGVIGTVVLDAEQFMKDVRS